MSIIIDGRYMMIKERAKLVHIGELSQGVYSMTLETALAGEAVPGQFVMIYPNSGEKLLGRPISICDADPAKQTLRLVYRVAGGGTQEFSKSAIGTEFDLLGPLGNGFISDGKEPKREDAKVLLIGGGIGAPPLYLLAKTIKDKFPKSDITAVLGYRSQNLGLFLKEEFEAVCRTEISTDDGSAGTHGTVMDAIAEKNIEADVIYACGPMVMLKAVKDYAAKQGIKAYISLEERMACGVGACLGCVVNTREVDHHSHVKNARVCTEGPVFEAGEVDI